MRAFALVVAVLVSLAAGCGSNEGESAQPTGAPVKTIQVVETEYKLSPSTVSVDAPGVYAFHAVNKGTTDHALEIEGEGVEAETPTMSPGKSATVKVELRKASYEMYCPVGNHKDEGMKGSISVAGAMPTGTNDDSGDTGDGYGYG